MPFKLDQDRASATLPRWIAGDFDPNAVEFDELAGAIAKLAKAWNRKPPNKRKPAD